MASNLSITTQRLQIRPFQSNDLEAVHSYSSNPAVMHFIPGGAMSVEKTMDFISENINEQPEFYALIHQESRELVGHLGFHPWFAPQIFELEWVLHPKHQNNGYTTEAAKALIQYGFETLNVHRIIATCQPENTASWRVMEKLGMTREGLFRQCIQQPDGSWWDEYFYAILKNEWSSNR